ncbi:MAG: hypothetical protein ACXWZ1_03560 [Gaiellaceae bacterium]
MTMRLAGALVLVVGVAALASASAYAGNGNGNGNANGNGQGNGSGKSEPAAAPVAAAAQQSTGQGNSAGAPGQLKKDEAPAPAATPSGSSVAQDAGAAQAGVKPSNDTAHDTHEAASSDKTKQYGNGKTAGQIAIQNGAAPSTVLHGPGNSQPHKAAPCSGGHEVDVHALKGKRGEACGGQPPSPPTPRPNPTPDPGKPGGDPAHGPTENRGNAPAVLPSTPADPSTPAKPRPAVSPQQAGVEIAAGVLSATGAIGGGTLPFTGFPIWVVVLIALALIVLGLMLRRGSGASSS